MNAAAWRIDLHGWSVRGRSLFPGVIASAVVAAAAAFLGQHYKAPVLLFALLLGMVMNFLSDGGACTPGIEFAGRQLLRIGVALLGLRITAHQVAALGIQPVIIVITGVVLTIGLSMLAAKALGYRSRFGLLTGGATAICGASAALALAAALPPSPLRERSTLFTVIGISALSTMAMIGYPALVRFVGLDAMQSGIFLGATIHDVAQVVGAGYSLSPEIGDTATVVKLMRVAMLLPVIVLASAMARRTGEGDSGKRPPVLPGFAVAFAVLLAVNSIGWIPPAAASAGNDASRWFLVAAIAAIGMKTKLKDVASVGLKPVLLMIGETVFLAVLVLAMLHWGH